jgi:hypothetical protein
MTAPQRPLMEMPAAPAPPPRALTPAAKRRSLLEPRVRFWWLACLALAAVALFFLVSRTWGWFEVLRITRHGTAVTAVIDEIGGDEFQARTDASPDDQVMMHFEFNGRKYEVSGYLDGRQKPLNLKENVPIRVDPADPQLWTYRTDVPPIGHVLLSAALVAPFAAAAGVISLLLRRKTLRIWETGAAHPYIVEKTSQTALAPLSRAVHCRDLDGHRKQLVCVFIPQRVADFKRGQVLWLIHPPAKPTAALAAVAYTG